METIARYSRKLFGSMAFLMLASLAGCGGGGGGGAASGTLGVSMTDEPACGFTAVNVTVTKVRVHQSSSAGVGDAGWTDLTLNPARKINLLSLTNGVLTSLGDMPLAAGHYTQLRLVLDANTGQNTANSVVASGSSTEVAIDTPSGVQSGIKLVNEFDVAAGQRVDLVLDFDACKSVVTRGNGAYLLMPVVKVIPFVINGIDGFVDTSLLGSNVVVSAQTSGTVVASTVPNAQTGEFFLARLPAGSYDVALTADGRATAVIAGVPVAASSTVMVSTQAAPIGLPVSSTHNISGTVVLSPASSTVAAYVAAKQTLGTGPTATVKTRAADLSTGAYSLTLPVAAPLLGQYGTGTLPIAFAAQTAASGKYSAEASADGYKTQSASADISAGDVPLQFTLVP